MLEKTDLRKCKEIAYNIIDNVKQVKIIDNSNVNIEKIHPFLLEAFSNIDLTKKEKLMSNLKKYNATVIEIYEVEKYINSVNPYFLMTRQINIFENEGAYILAKYACKSVIDDIKDFYEFAFWIRYPFTLDFLEKTIELINMKDFCKYLMEIWVNKNETLQIFKMKSFTFNYKKDQERFIKYFKLAEKKYLMNKNELDIYNKMDCNVTIYRGLAEFNKDNIRGISWTINKDIAQNIFANAEKGKKGYVYKAQINKKDIFSYCNARNEEEVIVDYNMLNNIELLES